VADVPILKVPVSIDEEGSVDEFLKKLQAARDSLKDISPAWGGLAPLPANPFVPPAQGGGASAGASGGSGGSAGKGAQPGSTSNFEQAAQASKDPHLSGQSSFIERFRKSSFESEKAWHLIVRDMEKAFKGLSGLSRMSVGLNPLGMLGAFGAVGAASASVGAAVIGADNSLAHQNLTQRQLGLKPGEEQSFLANYAKIGLDESNLASANAAKNSPMDAVKLQALNISMDQVKSLDTADLAALIAQKSGELYNKYGDQTGMYIQRMGLDEFTSVPAAQTAGSYLKDDPDAFRKMYQQEQADIPKFAQSQKDEDAATEAKRQLDEALMQDEAALDRAFLKLNPFVLDAANATAKWLDAFSHSDELGTDIKDLGDAFRGAVGDIESARDELNKLFGLTDKPKGETHSFELYSTPAGSFMANMIQGAKNAWGFATGKPLSQWETGPGRAIDWGYGGGSGASADGSGFTPDPNRSAVQAALEAKYQEPKGILGAVEEIESSGGKRNVNPKNPAVLGPYQFDEPTAKQYGITNRMNELQSEIGAARKLHDLYGKYHDWNAAIASYDGFGGLDADMAKYGADWQSHINEFQKSGETPSYLAKMRAQGVDLDDQAANRAEASRYYKSPAAADGGQTNPTYNFALPKREANPQMAPVALNLNVYKTPGSDVNVSVGGTTA
jgi:hypothetical protein